jgi:hypothetical protein
MTPGFKAIIGAAEADRRDLFLAAALRLGTPIQNVEKRGPISMQLRKPVSSTSLGR